MLKLFKKKEKDVKLYPFRHQWTVENVKWLVDGEGLEGWPEIKTRIELEDDKLIRLYMWPRGRGKKWKEYVGIGVWGWKMRLYGTVKVGEDGSRKREVGVADKDGHYRLDEYIHRSTLLESGNLFEDGALTVCLEGVAWDEDREYDPKKNLDTISTLLADPLVSWSRFAFRPPSPQEYFATEWEVEVDEEQIKTRKLNVAHLVELDGQTRLGVRLAPDTDHPKYLSLYFQLLQCSTDQVAMWWRVTVLGRWGGEVELKSETGIWRRGGETYFDKFQLWKHLLSSPHLSLEIIIIEDATLVDDWVSLYNLLNYTSIFRDLSSSWKASALHSQLPPPLTPPLSLLGTLLTKINNLISMAENGHATLYSATLSKIDIKSFLLPDHNIIIDDFTKTLPRLFNEAALQVAATFNSSVEVLHPGSTEHQAKYAFTINHTTTTVQRMVTLKLYLTVLLPDLIVNSDELAGGQQVDGLVNEEIVNVPAVSAVSESIFPNSLSEYTNLLLDKVEEMLSVAKKSGDTKVIHSYNFKGSNMKNALLAFDSRLKMNDLTMNMTNREGLTTDQQLSTFQDFLNKATSELQTLLNAERDKGTRKRSRSDEIESQTAHQYTATVLHLTNKCDQLQFTIRVTDSTGTALDIEHTIADSNLVESPSSSSATSIFAWIFSPATALIYPIPNPIRLWHYN